MPSATTCENLLEKVQVRELEITQYLKTSGDRFPIINFLIIALYIMGSLTLSVTFYLVFQDQPRHNGALSYLQDTSNESKVIRLFWCVFLGLIHFALAELLKVLLAVENHLYTMRKRN